MQHATECPSCQQGGMTSFDKRLLDAVGAAVAEIRGITYITPAARELMAAWEARAARHALDSGQSTLDTPRQVFDDSAAPGGYVCAEPVAEDQPGIAHDGKWVCGTPIESDPCPDHESGLRRRIAER